MMSRLSFVVLFGVFALSYAQNRGLVLLRGEPGVDGHVTLTETPEGLHLEGNVVGLKPGKHGFHVHQSGDLSKGCASTGGHYNPTNQTHGAPDDKVRHAGDLGNIVANDKGEATIHIIDKEISLSGDRSVFGRAIVVHSGEDDLGRGDHPDSKKTGNAGGRVACGIIGVL